MEGPDYIQSATWWTAIQQLVLWAQLLQQRGAHTLAVQGHTQTRLFCIHVSLFLLVFFKHRSSECEGNLDSGSIIHLTPSLQRNDTKMEISFPAPGAPQPCKKPPRFTRVEGTSAGQLSARSRRVSPSLPGPSRS